MARIALRTTAQRRGGEAAMAALLVGHDASSIAPSSRLALTTSPPRHGRCRLWVQTLDAADAPRHLPRSRAGSAARLPALPAPRCLSRGAEGRASRLVERAGAAFRRSRGLARHLRPRAG